MRKASTASECFPTADRAPPSLGERLGTEERIFVSPQVSGGGAPFHSDIAPRSGRMCEGHIPNEFSYISVSTPPCTRTLITPHGHAHTREIQTSLGSSKRQRRRGKGWEDGREAHTPVVSLAPGRGKRHAHNGILERKAILPQLESSSAPIAVHCVVSLIAVEGPRVCLDGIQILPLLETLIPLALGVGRHRCNPSHPSHRG